MLRINIDVSEKVNLHSKFVRTRVLEKAKEISPFAAKRYRENRTELTNEHGFMCFRRCSDAGARGRQQKERIKKDVRYQE